MEIIFTRAEIEQIILLHANMLVYGNFDTVSGGGYRSLPDTITVSEKEKVEVA